ncbi:MAG: TetR/AcrR family transcriptional regulator, partial [Pseudomonadota bacterium]
MTKQSSSAAQTEASPPPQDGRKLRSQRSREKIIDALFSLIRDGDPMPRIAEIADKAGVSLRTVFRHIEDVETLNREMAEQVEAEITPVVSAPLKATSWRGRLEEMLQRRAQIYEHVMPVKMAAGLRR